MQKFMQARALASRQTMTQARHFSQSIKPKPGAGAMPWIVGGLALGGFTLLNFKMSEMNANQQQYMSQGETFMSPIVQQRLGKTFGYFSYGILTTGATVYALRNSLAWAAVPWWAYMIGGVGLLFGAHLTPYETAYPLKLGFYTAFAGLMGLQVLPLI